MINHGVREGRKETDYIAGVNSPLGYEEVLPNGDWKPYLPTPETQWGTGGDKMNCVTQSYHNQVETRLNYFIATGQLPATGCPFFR